MGEQVRSKRAGAVENALGSSRGPAGVHDHSRIVGAGRLRFDRIGGTKLLERDAARSTF